MRLGPLLAHRRLRLPWVRFCTFIRSDDSRHLGRIRFGNFRLGMVLPCLRAFWLDRALPTSVLGLAAFLEFRRLDSIFFAEVVF